MERSGLITAYFLTYTMYSEFSTEISVVRSLKPKKKVEENVRLYLSCCSFCVDHRLASWIVLINSLQLNIVGQTDTQKGIFIALKFKLHFGLRLSLQGAFYGVMVNNGVYGLGWRNSAWSTPLLWNPAQPQPLNRF